MLTERLFALRRRSLTRRVRACAAPAWNNKRRGGTTLVILPTIMPDATATQLANIDYARFVLAPPQLAASSSRPSFVMNKAGPGHMELGEIFSTALGLKAPLRGLDAARRLQSAGAPFTYMTLTNDHLPSTERAHDATLRWERSTQAPEHALGATGAMRLIGPPGFYTEEAIRKKNFCRWSEQLARTHGDRSLRYSLPCAMGEATPGVFVPDYEQLLQAEEAVPIAVSASGNEAHPANAPPLWLVRTLRGRNRVIAAGAGIRFEVLPTSRVQPARLQAGKSLLLRFLDPPLLQRGVYLGTPVATRFEARIHGLVQWQPLRVWISGHGFARSGSPWWNYSTATTLDESNRAMWELSFAPDPACLSALPRPRPPWLSAERYEACKAGREGRRKGETMPAEGCCICLQVADRLDTEHSERGFATTGTLRKVEQIARQNGIAPGVLWRNADDAIVRFLMMQQRAFAQEANGSSLSRWQSPFSVDVAFGSDGKAWVYDSHMLPTWKRPAHWRQWLVDRGNALGLYASMMLGMSHVLTPVDEVDKLHRPFLPSLGTDARISAPLLLEFMRDQGFASVLGFRRAWPSTQSSRLERVASPQDAEFAALLERFGLLLPSVDALKGGCNARRRADLLLRETIWPFGGRLYANVTQPPLCEHTARVLEEWSRSGSGN